MEPDHEAYRETVREFLAREVAPAPARLGPRHTGSTGGVRPRGQSRHLRSCRSMSDYGGAGEPDYRYRMVVMRGDRAGQRAVLRPHRQPAGRPGAALPARSDQRRAEATLATRASPPVNDRRAGDDRTRRRQRSQRASAPPPAATATAGSSTARRHSSPAASWPTSWSWPPAPTPDGGSRAFSLFVVERDTPGFERGRQLDKIGLPAQDTAELFFHDAIGSRSQSARRRRARTALPDEPPAP